MPVTLNRSICCDLNETISREWLITNGSGAYAAGTVKIHSSASADAWLVLSDTYYPGWVASVDGQPTSVLRGDLLFRVVPVPAGEHDVEFHFEPASVKLGLLISLVALLLVAGGLVLAGGWPRSGRTTLK